MATSVETTESLDGILVPPYDTVDYTRNGSGQVTTATFLLNQNNMATLTNTFDESGFLTSRKVTYTQQGENLLRRVRRPIGPPIF